MKNNYCDISASCEIVNKLKAENEELKKINKANAKSYEKHWYKLEKYKQTLTEIIEIARKLERTQIRKDELLSQCTDGTEKSIKERERELLDFDMDICSLGEKLNAFCWLFENGKE